MKIYLASDHAGFELKALLAPHLAELGHEVEDLGPFAKVEDDDYPDFISKAAQQISEHPNNKAIVIGGSGQGEAIVANRFPKVRAAVFYGGASDILTLSREHNDANVLSLGARFMSEVEAKEAVKKWLETPFSGEEHHSRRIAKIEQYPPRSNTAPVSEW